MNMDGLDVEGVEEFLLGFQDKTCGALQAFEDDAAFREDVWDRDAGGGGRTRVLEGGATIERGGVNFSRVSGQALPPSASARRPELAGRPFEALGVSIIVHPVNPYAPTSHANLRFFHAPPNGDTSAVWWFGGGFDLTPYYGFEEDAVTWHRAARAACEPFGNGLYAECKQWCDDYFRIAHRGEQRGIGGLFFDDYDRDGFDSAFAFVRNVAAAYVTTYPAILRRRSALPYGDRERQFQLYRRGRYVEFNLVYDRGTLFGLQSRGRTESILVSMPPQVRWCYDWQPQPGSPAAALGERFLRPRDWLAEAE